VSESSKDFGVDINSVDGIGNNYENFVWEPIIVRKNALSSATEVDILFHFCTLKKLEYFQKSPIFSFSN